MAAEENELGVKEPSERRDIPELEAIAERSLTHCYVSLKCWLMTKLADSGISEPYLYFLCKNIWTRNSG